METRMLRTLVLALVLIKACAGITTPPTVAPTTTDPAVPGTSTLLPAPTPTPVSTATTPTPTSTPVPTTTVPTPTNTTAIPATTTASPVSTVPSSITPSTTLEASTATTATTATTNTTPMPAISTETPATTHISVTATPTSTTADTTLVATSATPTQPDSTAESTSGEITSSAEPHTPESTTDLSTTAETEPTEPVTTPPEPPTTTAPSEPNTAAPPKTTQSNVKYPPVTPEPYYTLSLNIGQSGDGTGITCVYPCPDYDRLIQELTDSFRAHVRGFVEVRDASSATSRKKRQTAQISLVIVFNTQTLLQSNSTQRQTQIESALNSLTGVVNVTPQELSTISDRFSKVTGLSCPTGYTFDVDMCQHDCLNYNCGDNGECRIHVSNNGTADVYCLCMSGYENEYSGPKCEDSSTGKSKVVAIVAGVLGTLCGILIIVLIWMCYRQGVFGGSDSKYQIGGQTNPTYSDIDMQKM